MGTLPDGLPSHLTGLTQSCCWPCSCHTPPGISTAAAAAPEVSSWLAASTNPPPPPPDTTTLDDDYDDGNCSCGSVDTLRAQLASFNITPAA
jgi:hypothetical protein